jgi:hypothetical protein
MGNIKQEIPWHAEARELAKQGLNSNQIGKILGRPGSSVRYAFCNLETRRVRQKLKKREERKTTGILLSNQGFFCAHQPREIKQYLAPKEQKDAAIKAFAKGEIDRGELMRRISL